MYPLWLSIFRYLEMFLLLTNYITKETKHLETCDFKYLIELFETLLIH